jgi:hypothetical protein
MANIGAARAKKPGGALAKLKAKKTNGEVKPAAAKGALAKLRQSKQQPKGALAALKARKRSSPLDFVEDDILYHNVIVHDADGKLGPVGSVDATKNGKTFTFHNRHGAWYHDTSEGKRHSPHNITVHQNLILRFDKELREQGIMTRADRASSRDEKEQAKRLRLAGLEAKRAAKKAAQQSS